ncbi:MAG: hypothetical protein EOO41_01285, partial [Methanobacteriota archaeon]
MTAAQHDSTRLPSASETGGPQPAFVIHTRADSSEAVGAVPVVREDETLVTLGSLLVIAGSVEGDDGDVHSMQQQQPSPSLPAALQFHLKNAAALLRRAPGRDVLHAAAATIQVQVGVFDTQRAGSGQDSGTAAVLPSVWLDSLVVGDTGHAHASDAQRPTSFVRVRLEKQDSVRVRSNAAREAAGRGAVSAVDCRVEVAGLLLDALPQTAIAALVLARRWKHAAATAAAVEVGDGCTSPAALPHASPPADAHVLSQQPAWAVGMQVHVELHILRCVVNVSPTAFANAMHAAPRVVASSSASPSPLAATLRLGVITVGAHAALASSRQALAMDDTAHCTATQQACKDEGQDTGSAQVTAAYAHLSSVTLHAGVSGQTHPDTQYRLCRLYSLEAAYSSAAPLSASSAAQGDRVWLQVGGTDVNVSTQLLHHAVTTRTAWEADVAHIRAALAALGGPVRASRPPTSVRRSRGGTSLDDDSLPTRLAASAQMAHSVRPEHALAACVEGARHTVVEFTPLLAAEVDLAPAWISLSQSMFIPPQAAAAAGGARSHPQATVQPPEPASSSTSSVAASAASSSTQFNAASASSPHLHLHRQRTERASTHSSHSAVADILASLDSQLPQLDRLDRAKLAFPTFSLRRSIASVMEFVLAHAPDPTQHAILTACDARGALAPTTAASHALLAAHVFVSALRLHVELATPLDHMPKPVSVSVWRPSWASLAVETTNVGCSLTLLPVRADCDIPLMGGELRDGMWRLPPWQRAAYGSLDIGDVSIHDNLAFESSRGGAALVGAAVRAIHRRDVRTRTTNRLLGRAPADDASSAAHAASGGRAQGGAVRQHHDHSRER